ncbi:MAG: hypothetical protein HOP11_02050 [Saprospiraceae bacterium]|nr:hypothetical protein [Saprospiraceae bacterium]
MNYCIKLLLRLVNFVSIVFLIISGNNLKASHIVGGDIQYRCLQGNRYEISLTLRRDCINGNPGAQFDNPAHVGIFNSDGVLQTQLGVNGVLRMSLLNNDTLNEVLTKDCGIIGGDVCVHTTTYIEIITLPIIPGGYILAYQRCCRNMTINNIISPEASGATYTLEIKEEAMKICNSSPKLGAFPPIYICGGNSIDFDLRATDSEGDSIVYKLCTPYVGASQAIPLPTTPSNPPYTFVQFKPSYDLNNMIGGVPPLQINSSSGRMIGFAEPVIAQYLIAYCIEEYRKGVLLSVLRRDFQINVRICSSAPEAEFKIEHAVCKLPVDIQCTDLSKDAFSSIQSWRWLVDDGVNIQNSTFQNPVFSINKEGIVKIRLVVESESGCSDTIQKELNIKIQKPNADFKTEFKACSFPILIQCTDLSTDTNSTIVSRSWVLNDGTSNQTSTLANPSFIINKEGTVRIILIVTNAAGCKDTMLTFENIKIQKPIADFKSEYASCKFPVNLKFTDLSVDNTSTIQSWNWNISDGVSNINSTIQNPNFTITKEGIIRAQLIITSASGCLDTIRKEIIIKILKPTFESIVDTICRNDTLEIKGDFPGTYIYEWTPATDLSCSDCPNPKAFPKVSTQYILRSIGVNCERLDTITVIVKSCIIDPCEIFIEKKCLPNGMIEVKVVDSNGKLVNPATFKHELFWNILASPTHPQYTLKNQNPIVLFSGDEFSLTSNHFSWHPKDPQTYENAKICTQRIKSKIELKCSGPCVDLEFILSSCEDDYDKSKNLLFPSEICESVCSDECNFIVALFETDGKLVNPSLYDIQWSTGGKGSFVHMMQPYYNTLSVVVKKDDCIWRGKYIKSCQQYSKLNSEEELIVRNIKEGNLNYIENLFKIHKELRVYNLSGLEVSSSFEGFMLLRQGIYLLSFIKNEEVNFIKIFK